MSQSELLPSLNLGTLVIVALIAVAALAFFLRKRSNRHSMKGQPDRNIAEKIDATKSARADPTGEGRIEP